MYERRDPGGIDPCCLRRLWFALAAALVTVTVLSSRPPHVAVAAQVPALPPSPAAGEPVQRDQDLINRYRFSERYGTNFDVPSDGTIGQYRVSFKESFTQAVDAPAKDGKVVTLPPVLRVNRMVYTELAAELSTLGTVKSLVRRYEKPAVAAGTEAKATIPNPMEGSTIWYQPRPPDLPQVICMTKDRRLTEEDFRTASLQLFVPDLLNVLPQTSLRIGDTWPISKLGAQTLVGGHNVKIDQGVLTGKLVEVRIDPRSTKRTAVLDVSGRVAVANGVTLQRVGVMGVRAQIEFSFPDRRAANRPPGATREDATIDARGAVVRLALAVAGTIQSGIDPKPRELKRELILDRVLENTGVGAISIPRVPPKPTQENSWLTYVDPQNRFHFRRPQRFYHPYEVGLSSEFGPEKIELVHRRAGPQGADRVILEFLPTTQRTPDDVQLSVISYWRAKGIDDADILRGSSLWLPQDQWPGMKVHRFESAILLRGRSSRGIERIHQDCYLAQLRENSSLIIDAMTAVDPPYELQKEVEEMLKTFQFGAPKPTS